MDLVSNAFSVLALNDGEDPSHLPSSTTDAVMDDSIVHVDAVQVDHITDISSRALVDEAGHSIIEQAAEESKRRSVVWLEYIVLPGREFEDGKQRAQCKHCLGKPYIADSHYETKNLKTHLDKCKKYQASKECQAQGGESRNSGRSSSDTPVVENGNEKEQKMVVPLAEYKLPLVWIDLEMTGLNIEVDRIIEIACIITDGNLSKSVEGPDLVIHQTQECLDKMGDWCQTHHGASGLTSKVLQSKISEQEAEKEVIQFVRKHVNTYTPLLAGNSVYVDYLFLKKYMPDLASVFPHVLVDVSSVKALCVRWYPRVQRKKPPKENKHRAMDDIRESIAELKYYKENIFKVSKK